ncbi:MAG: hypothetical protein R3E66_24955 [bacterium]
MKRILLLLTLVPTIALADETPPDISGTWAQLQVQTSVVTIPIAGDITSTTVALLRVEIAQNNKKLTVRTTPCAVDVDSEIDMVKTVIPQSTLAAIGTQQFRARLTQSERGWMFYQPPVMQTLGVKLDNAWKDAMPSDPKDKRLIDADNDGKPGVTVKIEGAIDGAIYVAQRSWSRLEGLVSGARIKGSLQWQTDQSVLDATSALLSTPPRARPSNVPSENYFRAIRIAPDASCEDILKIPRDAFTF